MPRLLKGTLLSAKVIIIAHFVAIGILSDGPGRSGQDRTAHGDLDRDPTAYIARRSRSDGPESKRTGELHFGLVSNKGIPSSMFAYQFD